ncbi:hypothetical protein E4T56_gene1174 [Termitomyces sp. T112]|nr:hypothetical protein E4T56_gene1174 [Termitomyces sp. T112]
MQREHDKVQREKDVAMGMVMEWLVQLQELQAHLRQWEVWAKMAAQQSEGSEVWRAWGRPNMGVPWAMVERVQRWEEWLANKAALGWQGVLSDWAREHRILLD